MINREEIAEAIAAYFVGKPVLRAYLFGSVARGDADEKSDIDVLVEFDQSGDGVDWFTYTDMIGELAKRLERKVDLVSINGLSKFIAPFVHKEKLLFMRDKIGEQARIEHIIQAIDFIKEFIADAEEADMQAKPMMRFAVERQLEIIGEASNFLRLDTKQAMPEIPWEKIKGFRNISVHEYFDIDPAIIWRTVVKHIPTLEIALTRYKNNQNK